MQLSYIFEETSIRDLMQAGIVPEWMYRECDYHGMRTAEDSLCEWDWEWGWDLGHGYDDSQLEILRQARKIVSDGIEEYHRNSVLQKMEQKRKDACKQWLKLYDALSAKLRPPFYKREIPAIVDYTIMYEEEPFFTIFYCWLTRYRHCTRTCIQMTMAGVFDGKQYTPEQIFEMSKDGILEKNTASLLTIHLAL